MSKDFPKKKPMYRLVQKESLSIMTYNPLEVWIFFILLCSGRFWASTFGQWCVSPSQ